MEEGGQGTGPGWETPVAPAYSLLTSPVGYVGATYYLSLLVVHSPVLNLCPDKD